MYIGSMVPIFLRITLKMNVAGHSEKVIELSFYPKRPHSLLWVVNPNPAFGRHFAVHVYPKFIPSEKTISLVISTINTILSTL
jgi:hypothetical protein